MKHEQEFFMVYGVGQGLPRVRHASVFEARHEAERLAKTVPGVEFIVLKADRSYRSPPALEVVQYQDFPF